MEKKRLLKRFHTLCSVVGVSEENKEALIGGYGVESSRDMTEVQLEMACRFLEGMQGETMKMLDRQRKSLISAVCSFCQEVDAEGWKAKSNRDRIEYAKRVACRAAGVEEFNKIGMTKARSLTYAFNKRRKDMEAVMEEAGRIINGTKEINNQLK